MKCMWHIILGWSVSYLYRTSFFGRFGRVIKKQQSQQIPIIWRKGCRLVYSSPSSCPQAPTKDSKCVKNALHNCFEASDTYQHTVLSRAHKEDIISFFDLWAVRLLNNKSQEVTIDLIPKRKKTRKFENWKNRSNFKEQFCRPPLLH